MSGLDFDDIAALWQQPDPEDQAIIEALARRTSRRGRLVDYAQIGLSVLVAVAVALAIFLAPAPATIVTGAIALLVLAWYNHRRHLLGQVERMLDTSGRAAFIQSATNSVTASLRRSTIGLCLLLPGALVGGILKFSYLSEGRIETLPERALAEITETPSDLAAIVALVLVFLFLIRSNLRLRAERRRLESLRLEYREEDLLDGEGS